MFNSHKGILLKAMNFNKIPLILSNQIKSMGLNINPLIILGHFAALSDLIKSMDLNIYPLIFKGHFATLSGQIKSVFQNSL